MLHTLCQSQDTKQEEEQEREVYTKVHLFRIQAKSAISDLGLIGLRLNWFDGLKWVDRDWQDWVDLDYLNWVNQDWQKDCLNWVVLDYTDLV